MPLAQANRFAAIGTPLGNDVLVLQHATIHEQLGGLFQIDAGLLSENGSIHFEDIVGANVTIRVAVATKKQRYFNGIVSRFAQRGSNTGYAAYHAIIVPHLWLLTRAAQCRIFQHKTVPDILKKMFSDFGIDYQESLRGSYQPRDYCVQYRETDFNFVSRLMEEEGIYYFFKHENGKHTVVLCDARASHTPADSPYDSISFRPQGARDTAGEFIREWSVEKALLSGAYAHTDFDFEAPKKNLFTTSEVSREHGHPGIEIYDYPGVYTKHDPGETYAKIRIQEIQSRYETLRGDTDARGIETGFLFTLKDAPRGDQNRRYLVTSASHSIQSDAFDAGGAHSSGPAYRCSFTAIAGSERFRAARVTPKPLVQGPQTAIVVGPGGDEIYTDKHGRVIVQFHWDRDGKCDEHSSCWIRVSQVWAGKGWGGMTIPRIGQEVIVEFLEGDPDRPIITGRVYNGDQTVPYPLPANKTRTTLKSLSSKGGGGFNELRFEDKKGEEQIFLHAEKDQDIRVKNIHREWIGKDRHLIVKGDQFEQVTGDKHLTVSGDQNEKIDGTLSQNITMEFQQKVGTNHALEAGQEIHLKAGVDLVIEAGMSITLKAGGGFIVIGPAGVTISGTPVLINSGGSAGAGAGSSPESAKPALEAADDNSGELGSTSANPIQRLTTKVTSTTVSPAAQVLQQAAINGTPFCAKCAAAAAAQAAANKG